MTTEELETIIRKLLEGTTMKTMHHGDNYEIRLDEWTEPFTEGEANEIVRIMGWDEW